MGLFTQFTIWSGGQTGVDQGALDAALALGIPHGGWCPKGRRSEVGPIPLKYLLTEHGSAKYPPRTKQNIHDTEATLILTCGPLCYQGPGTKLTRRYAYEEEKLEMILDLEENFKNQNPSSDLAEIFPDSYLLLGWLEKHNIQRLNVAGSRESSHPGIQYKTCLFLSCTLHSYKNRGNK